MPPSLASPSLPEQGQLVSVRSRHCIVNDMGHRILSPPAQNITLSGLQNMQVPELSIIRLLGEADGEWRAASREDLGDWFGSKGKWLEVPRVAVEARKVADRVIAIVQPVEKVRAKPQRPKVKGLFEE